MAPGFTWTELVVATACCIVSIVFLSAAFTGWMLAAMPGWQRWLIGLAALPLIVARPATIAVGLALAPRAAASAKARRAAG